MRTSDTLAELAAALSAAQAEMRTAPMTGVNPHLKNKYATLNDIIDTARGPLATHGLAYVQMPTSPADLAYSMIGLRTRLLHKSGEWLEDEMFFPVDPGSNRAVNPAQVAGGMLTYMRRYALAAMLGIVADEDADGNSPPETEKKAPQRKPTTQPATVDPVAVFVTAAEKRPGVQSVSFANGRLTDWVKYVTGGQFDPARADYLAEVLDRYCSAVADNGNTHTKAAAEKARADYEAGLAALAEAYRRSDAMHPNDPAAAQSTLDLENTDAERAALATAQGLNE